MLTIEEVLEEMVLMPREDVVTIAKALLAFEMLGEHADNPTDQLMGMMCARANAKYDEYFIHNPKASLFANLTIAEPNAKEDCQCQMPK